MLSLVVYVGFDCDGVGASPCISLGDPSGAALQVTQEGIGGGIVVRASAQAQAADASALNGAPSQWELHFLPVSDGGNGGGLGSFNWRGVSGDVLLADMEGHLSEAVVAATNAAASSLGEKNDKSSPDPSSSSSSSSAEVDGAGFARTSGFDRSVAAGSDKVAVLVQVELEEAEGSTGEFQLDLVMTKTAQEAMKTTTAAAAADATSADKTWGEWVTATLALHEAAFMGRFEAVWGLGKKTTGGEEGPGGGMGGVDEETALAAAVFAQSNLLGGLGFFAGTHKLKGGRDRSGDGGGRGGGGGGRGGGPGGRWCRRSSRRRRRGASSRVASPGTRGSTSCSCTAGTSRSRPTCSLTGSARSTDSAEGRTRVSACVHACVRV